ncbi:hypothetical protein PybrP1_006909 [[Pythium] brassicae (nom. inval.)]|nr:hypothetical protein PybrP1_006909 [[Pythium] brassicae (nom. inval.)]
MTTLEEAKAFLKQESVDGTNLYDHLSDVLLKILVERPENLNDTFESISAAVKLQRYVAPPQPAGVSESADTTSAKREIIKAEDDSGAPVSGVADVLDEANMFEWAGLGFSRSETFRLSVSLQRLAQTNATASMRFWGKVLGYGADFYIAEGELAAAAAEPEDPSAEEGAGGANKFTYWAMKDDGLYAWVQLPSVKREHILAARQLRRFVRSDLEGKVAGHPPFPGLEKHFLRAQIARITSGTVVCPAGYFQVNDDSGALEPADELEIKSAQDLADLGNWVHFSKELNAKFGRATPMPPQTNADGEDVPWEGEEFAPPLRALSDDAAGSWRVDRLPGTLIPAVGEFAVARSLVWPGAVGIAVGKKFLNVYVGNGAKFSPEPYQLQPPLPVQAGYGIGISEGEGDSESDAGPRPVLRFDALVEQKDLLEDPTPPEDEGE